MSNTPWPIEVTNHPPLRTCEGKAPEHEGMCQRTIDMVCGTSANRVRAIFTDPGLTPSREFLERFTAECFRQPQVYRNMILDNVKMDSLEKLDGGSVFYMWMNKTCPVGCDFCFFKSPKHSKKTDAVEITDEGINKLITFINSANIDKFVISGGGEPMMKKNKVLKLVKNVDVDKLVVVTSSFWSRNRGGTKKVVDGIRSAIGENPNDPEFVLRLSLDKDHVNRLCEKWEAHTDSLSTGPVGRFGYVHNLIDELSSGLDESNNPGFLIHTVMGDPTVEELLAELPVKSREDSGGEFTKRTQVELEGGFKFEIEYSQLFASDVKVDVNDRNTAGHNIDKFQDFITERRGGNMSLSFHGDQPKGVYYLMLYDGTVLVWGATSPDIEASIYKDNYAATMEQNLADPLTLGALENGTFYREDIISEVDDVAVKRARGMGVRDFHSRSLLEQESTRLYASIRIIQDYIEAGRISQDDIDEWPPVLRVLISIPKDRLKKIYKESATDILDQFLDDPNVGIDSLTSLYELTQLGHYPLEKQELFDRVMSSNIDDDIKHQFADRFISMAM